MLLVPSTEPELPELDEGLLPPQLPGTGAARASVENAPRRMTEKRMVTVVKKIVMLLAKRKKSSIELEHHSG